MLRLVPLVARRKYEYDEDVHLALDGSATVYVNASVPALVALRGASLDVDPRARLDRDDVRAFFETPVADVASVTTSRRDNRRYVHVRIEVDRHPPARRGARLCVVAVRSSSENDRFAGVSVSRSAPRRARRRQRGLDRQ